MSSDANRPRASSDGSSELASGHRVKQDAEGQGATRHPREGQPAWKWPLTQVLFCVSMLILGYDVSNIANIQPPIYEAFGHVELLPWVAIGYSSLCAAVALWLRQFAFFLPLKTLFVTYQGLAMLGAAVSGAAPNINAVIIGRAIIGIGCGGVYQLGTTYNALLSTPAEFPRVQGYAGVSWVIGLILGPIIGGAFAENQHATWRWAIYINLPVFAVIMALTLICLPAIQLEPNAPIFKRLSQMDWIGIVLHFAFTVLLCMALIFSGSTWPWNSGAAIAVWVVIGLVFIVYSTQQMKPFFTTRERQLFPVGLVKLHRSIILVCLSTASIGGTYGVTLYYTPLFFAFARGFEPVAAAVRLLPYIGVFIVSMLVATGILPAVRYYSPFYIVGGALVMIGAGVQTMITPETSDARVMGIQAIIAFGTGLMWQTGTGILNQLVSASARTPAEASRHRMDAAAMFVTFQLGGVAVVLSVAGCIFENLGYDLVRDSISGLGDFGPEDIREALAGVDSKLLLQETSPLLKSAVVHAVTTVLARIQWLVFAGGLVAFICGWCMPFEALDFSMGSANAAEAKAAAAAAPAAPVAAPAGVMTAAPETPASSQPVDTEKHAA